MSKLLALNSNERDALGVYDLLITAAARISIYDDATIKHIIALLEQRPEPETPALVEFVKKIQAVSD